MWTPGAGKEVRKVRPKVASFCRGLGLDIGCGDEKINKTAIGVDDSGNAANIKLDISANDALGLFDDCKFDYVFSSHELQYYIAWKAILDEWWRLVKPGGHLILYIPDPDYTPRIGTKGADEKLKSELYWQDAWGYLKDKGAKLVHSTRHNESNEHSWLLIIKKRIARVKKVLEQLVDIDKFGMVPFPRKKKTDKEVLVVRFGAIGDTLWLTPLFKKLKEDGYHVVFCTTEKGAEIVKESPYIDEFIIHEKKGNVIPPSKEGLEEYWKYIGKGFEKVINMTRTAEGPLLRIEGSPEYAEPFHKRHQDCNVNYMDYAFKHAGYPKLKGSIPEVHLSDMEDYMAKTFARLHQDKFVILWSLGGSAYHKNYLWAEQVGQTICHKHKDIEIITVGDYMCRLLEWSNSQTYNRSGVYTVRQSIAMTKYVDLVIGSETGILNAAGAFDTPKIIFLSHSSEENLTKYWKNVTPMWAEDCDCHPCHKLIYSNSCPRGDIVGEAPKCMENIDPNEVVAAIEDCYEKWRKKKVSREGSQPSVSPTAQT